MRHTIAPVLGEATVQDLREAVRGEIVIPGDDGYADACRLRTHGERATPLSPSG